MVRLGRRGSATSFARNNDRAAPEFEEGSGNVFADRGLDHADELFTRAKLGFHVVTILSGKKLPRARSRPCSGSSSRKSPTR